MFDRKIYPELLEHLENPEATVITGLRRVGKSTALKYLVKESKLENKVHFDLERIENRMLFTKDSYADMERVIESMGFDFSKPGIIAIDEIQLIKSMPSIMKAWFDDYGTKFIVTGSSSFYIKNHFTESLAGRKRIFEMFPLDFEEFIIFKQAGNANFHKESMKFFLPNVHTKYKKLYDEYLQFGGFPAVVLATKEKDKVAYLKDILNSHIELDVKLLGDVKASDDLYKLILLLANRVGSKLDYSKIAAILGINRVKIKDYVTLLEYTYLIKIVKPFTSGIDKEISKQPKLYFGDNGLLNICAQISSGSSFENAVCLQLQHKGKVNYYEKTSGTEIDFILNGEMAIEVKETCSPYDLASLNRRAAMLKMNKALLIGNQAPLSGFEEFVWGGNIF